MGRLGALCFHFPRTPSLPSTHLCLPDSSQPGWLSFSAAGNASCTARSPLQAAPAPGGSPCPVLWGRQGCSGLSGAAWSSTGEGSAHIASPELKKYLVLLEERFRGSAGAISQHLHPPPFAFLISLIRQRGGAAWEGARRKRGQGGMAGSRRGGWQSPAAGEIKGREAL